MISLRHDDEEGESFLVCLSDRLGIVLPQSHGGRQNVLVKFVWGVSPSILMIIYVCDYKKYQLAYNDFSPSIYRRRLSKISREPPHSSRWRLWVVSRRVHRAFRVVGGGSFSPPCVGGVSGWFPPFHAEWVGGYFILSVAGPHPWAWWSSNVTPRLAFPPRMLFELLDHGLGLSLIGPVEFRPVQF
jgi:hypothetical protein